MSLSPPPRYEALVLAAGKASRFGGDKMSAPLEGEPLLFHAIRAARAAPVQRVIVVARADTPLGTWPDAPPVDVVRVASDALSSSLKAGLRTLGEVDGVFVFLGDMPRIEAGQAARLARAIGSARAAAPRLKGRPGHPVLLSASTFPQLMELNGDRGAGSLLQGWPDVVWDDAPDLSTQIDVDRPEDLARLQGPEDGKPQA